MDDIAAIQRQLEALSVQMQVMNNDIVEIDTFLSQMDGEIVQLGSDIAALKEAVFHAEDIEADDIKDPRMK